MSRGRRVLDLVVAAVGLIALAPVLLVVSALVRLTSPGPALFRQSRLTTGRREFTIYKFRTMRDGGAGPDFTVPGDARVTRVGAVLRHTSLDELPQLFNVLRGEMTLVGPRPETPDLAAGYPPDLAFVLDHTPGLTGPAQLRLRDRVSFAANTGDSGNTADGDDSAGGFDADDAGDSADATHRYYERIVPARVAEDLTYLRRPTLTATVRVLGQTAAYIVTGRPPAK